MRNKYRESRLESISASGDVRPASDSVTTLQMCRGELAFFFIPAILLAMFALVFFLIVMAVYFPASELGLWAGSVLDWFLAPLLGE